MYYKSYGTLGEEYGDCLEELKKLPNDCADSVVTVPPYCSGGFTESAQKSTLKQGIQKEDETYKRLGWFSNDNIPQ